MNLTATITGGIGTTTLQWQEFSGGSWQVIVGATSANYNTGILTIGNYDYRIIVTQGDGCSVTSATSSITVASDPVVSISTSTNELCEGASALITANVTGGAGTSTYVWEINPGTGWEIIAGATTSAYATAGLPAGTMSIE